MAVPAVSVIRRAMKDSFITWAVDSHCSAVIDQERLVDLRYQIPRREWKKVHVSWAKQLRHFARLRQFRFDYGIDLQGHSKTALCLRIASPKNRFAARATDLAAYVLNPVANLPMKGLHCVERNLLSLSMIGKFEVSSAPIMPRVELLPDLPERDLSRLATISISAGSPSKCYSPELWAQVAQILLKEGFEVALLGGPGDPQPTVEGTRNWIGKLSLEETMAAVARSKIHFAADTGTGHIAAAYGVPVVSIFGYTDIVKYRPYTENGVVLDAGKTMDGVDSEQIVNSAQLLVARQNAFLN